MQSPHTTLAFSCEGLMDAGDVSGGSLNVGSKDILKRLGEHY
jgi:hypothetical protein